MHFLQALIVASSAALIAAAPAPEPINIGLDDVILYGKGRYAIVKRSEVDEIQKIRESGVLPPKPTELEEGMFVVAGGKNKSVEGQAVAAEKRDGERLIIPNPHQRFLGWDVIMSSVTKGGPEKTRVTVTSGYSIANSLAVGMSSEVKLIQDFLSVTTKIDYTQTWTSDQTQQFSAEVPAGKYGAFVSNAWTDRESGNVWKGKIGEEGSLTPYQADSFTSKSYGNLNWVDGMITLCVQDKMPMPRCIGEGTL
ncbi:hypothetical protein IAQ61_007330 [Plenodomus lingam]|uniref:Celp0028 effector like protein n=1 Tax=Leptosphaeria maculans (strain JN3 / isolate v23.1.3 / race Av1-4-5-6-7-8) TaxID=985895 RepID=E5A0W2_LEPMJ|nr:hypothetical protein LEMA_P103890.1 [Plenodomus lingam JN3]KAH9868023.1 hypothetical protein IAQ61_007330 [Plenodomus lingam]CBX97258.1 hypothetical protein LEMA_P103890.1 [Plenodomus lingam JN3]